MKILVNSYPRSGTNTFVNSIRAAISGQRDPAIEEFFHNDTWIANSHIPAIFLGTFPEDVIISTIIRHPLDAISSNSFRWAKGHTGNVIHGKIVIDKDQIRKNTELDQELVTLIDHQIEQYCSYILCYLKNKDNVVAISYEDLQTNVKKCVDMVLPGYNNLNYDAATFAVKNPSQPTKEKTDLYYSVRKYVQSSSRYQDALEYYNQALPPDPGKDYTKSKSIDLNI